MENPRIDVAANLLKQCKAEGKTYYEAQQVLAQRGYTQAEIEQASYQFPYNDISPNENNPAESSVPPQPISDNEVHNIELQKAGDKMNQDYWYSFIPIIGSFFKYKRIGDYTKYESLKTGRSRPNVLLIWIAVMAGGAFVALFAAPWFVNLFTDNGSTVYLSHYVGIIVAILLLLFVFRGKNQG